ncbi:MAG TPA: glycosyltransferase [Rhodocyclaceae bacterium]|nr:glycosyltransferase [Rhodocyclaceae bacterium]
MSRPIRTLLFSTLFPSSARPVHGIFVETRLRELLASGEVETKVVAPVPWFPSRHPRFGEYAQYAATPAHEIRNGIEVHHPRYFLPPRVGMNVAPWLMAKSALATVRRLQAVGFDFDLIDAHYYYPDGVAAAAIARALNKPLVITARGTDLNLIPQYPRPRRLILEAAQQAAASIGVCKALMDVLGDLGAECDKLHVLRNGVDLERFQPIERSAARAHLQLPEASGRLLLSVGHLIERKGHDIAIAALPLLPADTRLLIVGSGPECERLEQQAAALGVAERVRFTGLVANAELKWWYSAADALLLCSSREGWANVLLEAMACGTPVIATNLWGTPEVVSCPEAGELMHDRSPAGLAAAFARLFARQPQRADVRRHAEDFSWAATTAGQLRLFRQVLGQS